MRKRRKSQLGQKLHNLRVKHNMSMKNYAQKLGKKYHTLIMIERGERKASEALIDDIAELFGLNKNAREELYILAKISAESFVFSPEYDDVNLRLILSMLENRDCLNDKVLSKIIDLLYEAIRKSHL